MSFEEQIMAKDKYARMFSCLMEATVVIILQICSTTRVVLAGEYLKLGNIRSREAFRPVTPERKFFMDYKLGMSRGPTPS